MRARGAGRDSRGKREPKSQALQRRVGRVTGLMPRAGNFRNICAAASDVICIRPRPQHTPSPLHTSQHLPLPPPPDMWLLAFSCFSISFPPPSFFPLFCQRAGSGFLCNLSACCTSCLTMLHLWFYYIAARNLWPSRLFASCDRNLQAAAAVAAATDLWAPKTSRKLRLKTTLCK